VPHPLYGGKPACRQAVAKGSASAGAMAMAVQKPPELKDGCSVKTFFAAALASSGRPSFASAAASKLCDTLKLGLAWTARRAAGKNGR